MCILKAIDAILIVVKCLLELLLGVHNKRSLLGDWLTNRLSSDQHKLSSFFRFKSMHILLLFVSLMQDTAVECIDKLLPFIMNLSFIDKDDGVPNSRNGQFKSSSRKYVHIEEI
jgi:hypothetical protein